MTVNEAERSIVSGVERSIVSGVERLRLGRSSGGNTTGLQPVKKNTGQPLDKLWALSLSKRPSDDGCSENGKNLDSGAWVDLANASGLPPRIFTHRRPAFGLSILLVYIRAVVECKLIEYLSAAR
jgi:hypothetical protein